MVQAHRGVLTIKLFVPAIYHVSRVQKIAVVTTFLFDGQSWYNVRMTIEKSSSSHAACLPRRSGTKAGVLECGGSDAAFHRIGRLGCLHSPRMLQVVAPLLLKMLHLKPININDVADVAPFPTSSICCCLNQGSAPHPCSFPPRRDESRPVKPSQGVFKKILFSRLGQNRPTRPQFRSAMVGYGRPPGGGYVHEH